MGPEQPGPRSSAKLNQDFGAKESGLHGKANAHVSKTFTMSSSMFVWTERERDRQNNDRRKIET